MQETTSIDFLWDALLKSAHSVMKDYQDKCFKRRRSLDCFTVVLLIFRLVFSKNKMGTNTAILDFWNKARECIPRLKSVNPVAGSTFCDARSKLDEDIFSDLNRIFIAEFEKQNEEKYLWHGHRLFCIDGSKLNLPRQLHNEGYKFPNSQSHYPYGLLSCLYQLKSKLPYDFELTSELNERKCAHKHLKKLKSDDLVVYDRGYSGYAILEEHERKGIHTVFRLQGNSFYAIRDFISSSEQDKIIEIRPVKRSIKDIRKAHPEIEIRTIRLRLLKYMIDGNQYCLGTTLLDRQKYPATIFPDLYHSRWGIEELYKIKKETLNLESFYGKTERKVKQEIFASFLLLTVSRIFSNEAEAQINIALSEESANNPEAEEKEAFHINAKVSKKNFHSRLISNHAC